jgi:hypothetical protein
MATAWVYVINEGAGVPRIARSSHAGITVAQRQSGEYVVAFPVSARGLAAVATLGNSAGAITAVPGENSSLPPNQVRVFTHALEGGLRGNFDFSLAVFYRETTWWPWFIAGAAALTALGFALYGTFGGR